MVGNFGFRLFTISSVERVDEIFCSSHEDTKIAERLFSSSLVAVVTTTEADKLKVNTILKKIRRRFVPFLAVTRDKVTFYNIRLKCNSFMSFSSDSASK